MPRPYLKRTEQWPSLSFAELREELATVLRSFQVESIPILPIPLPNPCDSSLSTPNSQPLSTFPFHSLPPEIRYEVYRHLIVSPDGIGARPDLKSPAYSARCQREHRHSALATLASAQLLDDLTTYRHPILSASRLLRAESLPIFCRQNTFYFAHACVLYKFLHFLTPEARTNIRHIRFCSHEDENRVVPHLLAVLITFRVACPALETLELASVNAFRGKVEKRYLEFPVHDPLGWLFRSPSYTGGWRSISESVWLGPDDQELRSYRTCETEIESDTTHPFPVFEKPRMYSVPMKFKNPRQEAVYCRSRVCWPGIGLVNAKKERFRDVLITARAMAEAILEGEAKTGLITSSELERRERDIVQAWCGGTTAVPLDLQQKVVHAK